ncbi:Hemicentin-1-like 3, partial [Homarus americanus]
NLDDNPVSPPSPPGASQGHNEVIVLEGQEADVPCVTTSTQDKSSPIHEPDSKHLRPQLILWYKDSIKSTIYSYDGRDPDRERHWSQRRSLGGSVTLKMPSSPDSRPQLAFLKISHTTETDAGMYRCRVDFYRAPSRNTHTKLIVVAPPKQPKVEVWVEGRWLEATHDTPTPTVEVGTRLRLQCSTSGGRPVSTVTWWRGGQQLLGDTKALNGQVVSTVDVSVTQEDAHTPIVCQASNTHLMPPLRTPFQMLVLSSPSWVRVVGADKTMSVGTSYTVECRSRGATPPPVLTWAVGNDHNIHASATTDAEGETVSRLVYTPKVAHVGAHLTCTARPPDHAHHHAHSSQSTPNVWTKSDSVPLSIMYKPEVELDLQRIRASGDSATPKPRRPPFSPSLYRGKDQAKSSTKRDYAKTKGVMNEESNKGKHSSDDEEVVNLVEGSGVVLQCHVRANPPAYHVSWSRDGAPLSPGMSHGLVVGNMSVVLPKLQRHDAANYTCTAHNAEGSTRSNPITLHVIHGPECLRNTPQVLGVPRHHALNVTCQVTAHPPPTAFSWALKSSRGLLQVPEEMITFVGSTSWISYTPRATVDYGELLCWATTPTGRQRDPCVSRLVPADKPDAPERCGVSHRTPNSLTVACTAAHDGGLPQTFYIRVFHEGRLIANSTSVTSEIIVYDLEPDTRYHLTLWSANTHGTSRRTAFYASTAPSNTSTTSSMNGHSSSNREGPMTILGPSLVAVVVVVTVLGVVLGVVLGIVTQKISVPHSFSHDTDEEEPPESPPVTGRSRVPMGRLGRRNRSFIGDKGKPTARYDVVIPAPARQDSHIYADPIALRRERAHQAIPTINTTVIPETDCPTFSMTATEFGIKSQSFSWHLPNSRLLRNKIDLKVQSREIPRKPVRVEPPKLPTSGECNSVTPITRTKPAPALEFRLILIPETSKMLQFALERDTRLISYLSKDSTVSSSPSKFPTITEEEEYKPRSVNTDLQHQKNYSVTPYESIPVQSRAIIENENHRQTPTLQPIQEHPVDSAVVTHQRDTPQQSGASVEIKRPKTISTDIQDIINQQQIPDIEVSDYDNHKIPTPPSPEPDITNKTTQERTPGDTHQARPSIYRHENQNKLPNPRPYSVPNNQSTATKRVRIVIDNEDETMAKIGRHLLPRPRGMKISGNGQGRAIPSIPLAGKLKISRGDDSETTAKIGCQLLRRPQEVKVFRNGQGHAIPSIPLAGKLSRHHPYVAPLANIKRGLRTPITPSMKRLTEPLIMPEVTSSPQPPTPSTTFGVLRKPRIGLTSLFSLSSSSCSSSSSSSSSSYLSRWTSKRSREATPSPFTDIRMREGVLKRSSRRSSFGSLVSRPRSVHMSSGPEQALHCCVDSDCLSSSSTPSSPRSSSSSSCLPHSSSSSSPVSSFYSSENSLSISASLSHSSSSSSFQFTSSSSSSAVSSSPFSSFLSPSLTSPSSSSFLSLASCSTSPDSVFSGQITPT